MARTVHGQAKMKVCAVLRPVTSLQVCTDIYSAVTACRTVYMLSQQCVHLFHFCERLSDTFRTAKHCQATVCTSQLAFVLSQTKHIITFDFECGPQKV